MIFTKIQVKNDIRLSLKYEQHECMIYLMNTKYNKHRIDDEK